VKAKTSILSVLGCVVICVNACADDTVNVAQLRISFAKPPVAPATHGELPREALYPEAFDSREHGPFTNVVGGRIAALTVTWADPQRFKSERQAESLIRELLTSTNTQTCTYHVWSFVDGTPALVARVKHIDGAEGKWVVWGPPPALCWAYQDGKQKWWWGYWRELNAPYPKGLQPEKDR
jgi:hypothetical protein